MSANRSCTVVGCGRSLHAKGLCNMHRLRLSHHGTLETQYLPLAERLEAKIYRAPSGCWIWLGAVVGNGYGHIGTGSRLTGDRRMTLTHRVAWELHVGPIPDGMQLDHLCHRIRCCNPMHLQPVTSVKNHSRRLAHWTGRICSADGCGLRGTRRGLCGTHYGQRRRAA